MVDRVNGLGVRGARSLPVLVRRSAAGVKPVVASSLRNAATVSGDAGSGR